MWCESVSIAGVIYEETDRYNVPLMPARGFSSDSYLFQAAEYIKAEGRPAYLYYFGDWDPSGKIIPEVIERRPREFAPGCEIHFERLFVKPEQIEEWSLPTKDVPDDHPHGRGRIGGTVEAEAVPARVTRRLVREAIEQHLDLQEVIVLEVSEESEREHLERFSDAMAAAE